MVSFLVLYGTGEGRTAAVATRITDAIVERGHDATMIDADDLPSKLDLEEFTAETGRHPDRVGFSGGALRYSEYGLLKRLLMKQIARRTLSDMPEADASGGIGFTNWDEIEAFASDVAAFVEGRSGVTPPAVGGQTESE